MKIEQFEDIEAWQLARELTRKVYRLTKKPGFTKDYGLNRQIQDAAGSSIHMPRVSIPRQMQSLSGSCDMPSGLARKSRVNSMLHWMKSDAFVKSLKNTLLSS